MSANYRIPSGRDGKGADGSARLYPASSGDLGAVLVLAHGASAGHDSPFIVSYAKGLASRGLQVVTFNFPYIDAAAGGKRSAPPSAAQLVSCWRDVARAVREKDPERPLFAGGKSMGGRVASMLAAEMEPGELLMAGLVFLGYPLHPPASSEKVRVSHWPDIQIPALFVQGSRDAFGSPDEIRSHLPKFGGEAELMVVEGGDHSFKVTRGGKGRQQEVHDEVQDAIVRWVLDTGRAGL
jgi:predicted alpha/beta-hydrolase family hydrolase